MVAFLIPNWNGCGCNFEMVAEEASRGTERRALGQPDEQLVDEVIRLAKAMFADAARLPLVDRVIASYPAMVPRAARVAGGLRQWPGQSWEQESRTATARVRSARRLGPGGQLRAPMARDPQASPETTCGRGRPLSVKANRRDWAIFTRYELALALRRSQLVRSRRHRRGRK